MSAAAQLDAAGVPALALRDLDVAYRVRGTWRQVLRSVSFEIGRGESYGLVGESGCGKSTAAFAVMRYLPRNGRVTAGSIHVGGRDLLAMSEREVCRLRASEVSMVYQNPGAALNPSIRVGDQVAEVFTIAGMDKATARERAREMLAKVQISGPESVMRRYPHQLSGGMQQRVVIAMALASDPALLILDEPTTGLDATVEAEVLDLVAALREEFSTSVLFISHNLAVIAKMCERVGVLYAGKLVEEGPADDVFADPRHPYTVGLLRCIPRRGVRKDEKRLDTIPGSLPPLGAHLPACVFVDRCGLAQPVCGEKAPPPYEVSPTRRSRCHFWEIAHEVPYTAAEGKPAPQGRQGEERAPVIELEHVNKTFRQEGAEIRALADVTLSLRPGETLGLVGESGSGKTTLARVLLGLTEPDPESRLELDDRPLEPRIGARSTDDVRAIQIVFQNPDAALNRRFSVRRIIGRAITKLARVGGERRERRLHDLAHAVRLDERHLSARPNQLSGGLKQRVAIARAFAGAPRIVVCDEPTSALDVSVQAAILNLLADLQIDEGVTYLFISHDLGVVRYLSDRIAVLYLGRVMEVGSAEQVFNPPHHPYTEALLSAVPTLEENGDGDHGRIRLEGDIPSAANPPSGCVFHTRCPRKWGPICEQEEPQLKEVEPGHFLRCHISIEELRRLQTEARTGGRAG
ncbi:MAG: ABC transporter ATP-binding protein [Actinomycetota bacterium]|nr:ABC transporter ATP-binding protein [Actinomycetota bacterium]